MQTLFLCILVYYSLTVCCLGDSSKEEDVLHYASQDAAAK